MRFFALLCLMLLSSTEATLRRYRTRVMKKKGGDPSARALVAPSEDLAFELYRVLVSTVPEENIVFSPMSVYLSLGMLLLGSSSQTKAQILRALGLRSQQDLEDRLHQDFRHLLLGLNQPTDGFQLNMGNTLFSDKAIEVRDTFLSAIKMLYLADTFSVDFGDPTGTQKQINDYVAKRTNNKIVDLIQNLDGSHIMMIVNFIFFKAKWETAFSPENIQQEVFYVNPETEVQVPMMSREGDYYYFLDQNLSCSVVGVPYLGNGTAMFILPDDGMLQRVEKGLKGKTLKKWLEASTKRRIDLHIPKFSVQGFYHLEDILPKLGIKDVFTSHADLSGITGHRNTQVSEMVHKAVVEVDETGTKAAAATGTVITFRSAHLKTPELRLNKPFLMAVLKNQNLLFFGKVSRP
ncbi:hypothetical protein NP303_25005, partial [Salmonella enterica]|nr:hypothetical protein [Salmonella enterica]